MKPVYSYYRRLWETAWFDQSKQLKPKILKAILYIGSNGILGGITLSLCEMYILILLIFLFLSK